MFFNKKKYNSIAIVVLAFVILTTTFFTQPVLASECSNSSGHSYSKSYICDEKKMKYTCSHCRDTYSESVNPIEITIKHTGDISPYFSSSAMSYISGRKYKISSTGGYGDVQYKYELYKNSTATTPIETKDFSTTTNYNVTTESYSFSGENYIIKVTAKDDYGNISIYSFLVEDLSEENKSIENIGHNYMASVKNKTCRTAAEVTYTCVHCTKSYSEEVQDISISLLFTGTSSAVVNGIGKYSRNYNIIATGGYGNLQYKGELFTSETSTSPIGTFGFSGDSEFSVSNSGSSFVAGNKVVKITVKDNYGNTSNATFKISDESMIDSEILVGECEESDWIVDTPPSCLDAGSKHKECTVCSTVLEETDIPAVGHQFEATIINATNTENGYIKYTCTCDDEYTCSFPTGLSAIYGQTLNEITLVNDSGNVEGVWSWMKPSSYVGNVSPTPETFKAKFVPADIEHYETVEDINIPLTVNPKNITISVDAIPDAEYTSSQIKPTVVVTGDGKTLTENIDYVAEYGENLSVGIGSVTVKYKENGNYIFDEVVENFNIVAKLGQISISGDLNVAFGEIVPDVTVTKNNIAGNITVYYYTNANCTEGKTTIKPNVVGDYWVQAEMAADTNYGSAVSNVLSFAIARANITPAVSITGWTYKDSANVPSVTGNTENGAVTYKYKVKTAADSAYSTAVPTNAGEYTVKAEIAETANYNSGSATANFTIAPKALDSAMVATPEAQAYTDSEIKPTPAVTDGTALANNTDFTYGYEDNTYVGTAKVKVIGKGNYSGEVVKEFSITAVDQAPAITATAHVTKGGNTVDLKPLVANAKGDVSFTISGEANGCTIDNGVLTSGENHGTVKINVAITAKDVNGDTVNEYNAYSLADAITVTVNDKETQAALNITSVTTVTYGQTLTLTSRGGSGSGEVTYAVTNGTGEATLNGDVLTPSKVGTVTVVATKSGDATYNSISSAPVVITIEKIKVAIPAEDLATYTYTGTEQTYRIAENAAYTIAGNKQTNANETGYTVTVTLNDTETHAWSDDSVEVKNYTFIIGKATITVVAKNQQVYVNGTAPVLDADDYTVTGLVNGETLKTAPTIEYETTPDTSATGSVVIKVYGAEAPVGGNYNDVVHTNGSLTIKKKSSGGGSISVSKYTVKFETNGGSEVANKTVNRNAVLEAPEAPTNDGFKFDGWFTDKKLTTAYDFTAKVTKDFTLYAKWTEIEKDPEVDKPEDKDDSETTVWKNPFNDVKSNDWFYANVQYVVENKLMNGVAVDKFAPSATLTRAMLVTVLYRNEGEPATNRSIPFADVDMGAYYASAVVWAKQNGIVNGVTETEFAPDANITREQISAIMFRYAQYKGMDAVTLEENLHFTDTNEISEYAVSAMNWAVGTGLMKGKSATTINPKDNATRAEIAAILQRFVENVK